MALNVSTFGIIHKDLCTVRKNPVAAKRVESRGGRIWACLKNYKSIPVTATGSGSSVDDRCNCQGAGQDCGKKLHVGGVEDEVPMKVIKFEESQCDPLDN